MPAPFGTGEITTRLRRLLDLRGQFPMQVDETLVPVAMAQDMSQAPFRRSGRRWWILQVEAPGPAASGSIIINNDSSSFQMVDRVYAILGLPAAGLRGILNIGPCPQQAGAGQAPVTTEIIKLSSLAASPFGEFIGLRVLANALPPGAFPQLSAFSDVSVAATGFGTPAVLELKELDMAIPPGGAMAIWSTQLNVTVSLSISGRFFDDVPRNTQT